jgi:uncharacterized protein (DUF305 family)
MYKKLAIAISINTLLMYLIGYVMIDRFDHFYLNINRVYMALMMVAPMVIVMLLVMRSMFENKKLNYVLIAASAGLFILSFMLVRTQVPVGDTQFLRSMIPHHSSAIVMCQEADLTNPEIIKLCGEIIKAQEEEISEMKTILTGSGN